MDRDSPIIAMSETPANPPNPAVPAVVTLPGTVQVSKKELMAPKPIFVADVAEEYRARFAAVANDDVFRRCTTFRAQCKRAYAIINGGLPKKQRVPLKHFAAFFRVRSCASIHTQITAPTDDYVFCGRRPILTDADVDAIIEWVAESIDNPVPSSRSTTLLNASRPCCTRPSRRTASAPISPHGAQQRS